MSKEKVKAAIMFLDVVGYSALTDHQLAAFSRYMEAIDQVLKAHYPNREGLHDHNTWGDAVVLVGSDPLKLARAAQAISNEFARISTRKPPHIECRIALHWGDVHLDKDPIRDGAPRVYGRSLSHAARVEPIVLPGEIWVTEEFKRAIEANKTHSHIKFLSKDLQDLSKNYATTPLWGMTIGKQRKSKVFAKHTQLLGKRSYFSLLKRLVSTDNKEPIFRAAAGTMNLVPQWIRQLRKAKKKIRIKEIRIKHISFKFAKLLVANNALANNYWRTLQRNINKLARILPSGITIKCAAWRGFPPFHGAICGKHALIGRFESSDAGDLSHHTGLRYIDGRIAPEMFKYRKRLFEHDFKGQLRRVLRTKGGSYRQVWRAS